MEENKSFTSSRKYKVNLKVEGVCWREVIQLGSCFLEKESRH